jgi:hypothetical protein
VAVGDPEQDVLYSQLLQLAHDAPLTIERAAARRGVAVVVMRDGTRLRATYPREEALLDLEELLERAGVPFEPLG